MSFTRGYCMHILLRPYLQMNPCKCFCTDRYSASWYILRHCLHNILPSDTGRSIRLNVISCCTAECLKAELNLMTFWTFTFLFGMEYWCNLTTWTSSPLISYVSTRLIVHNELTKTQVQARLKMIYPANWGITIKRLIDYNDYHVNNIPYKTPHNCRVQRNQLFVSLTYPDFQTWRKHAQWHAIAIDWL